MPTFIKTVTFRVKLCESILCSDAQSRFAAGSTEIQMARPIPDIGAGRSTVGCLATTLTIGIPGVDNKPSFVGDWFGAEIPVDVALCALRSLVESTLFSRVVWSIA